MSKRALNLSMDVELIKFIKHKAIEENTTVSKLLEEYIEAMKCNKNVIRAIRDIIK